jgi:hypothetical protein
LFAGWQQPPTSALNFEAHLDGPDGKLLGKGALAPPAKEQKAGAIRVPVQAVTDGKMHSVYIVYKPTDPNAPMQAGLSAIQFNPK